ncbi:MAG: hypothetical protein R6U64_09535 [Bacteroidales bacterium]
MTPKEDKVLVLPDNTIVVAIAMPSGQEWALAATFCPVKISDMDQQQQQEFKREHQHYATTGFGGTNYAITLVDLYQSASHPYNDFTDQMLEKLFLKAADSWYGHLQSTIN